MAEANAHYYATRDPLGAAGDFVTAPEISQMFGELVGLWLADLWMRAGSPANVHYVELGPGRGTLAADALRAMRSVGLTPPVHFVETSPALRAAQAERVPHAAWHDMVAALPHDGALLVVANEFFDALPVRQIVATDLGWRERTVACTDGAFAAGTGETVPESLLPEALLGAAPGTVVESSPPRARSAPSCRRGSPTRAAARSSSTMAIRGRPLATRSRRCAATAMPIPSPIRARTT
jgi:NADH dehydrogenase [ubiquinone] 1 alpha subcomplex assembly factor 7